MFILTVTLALAAPEVTGEVAPRGHVQDRVVADDADLVLLYASEQDGEPGPCGCSASPKGGLERIDRYAEAVRATGSPTLLVNAGAWLSPREDHDNSALHRGLRHVVFDALNVSYRDWPDVASGLRPGLVSANLRHPDLPVLRYRVVEAGGRKVAITGVSRPGLPWRQPDGLEERAPVAALTALVPEMQARADLIVVLAYDVAGEVPALAAVPGVDVVIEADGYEARWGPWVEGDAVWVRSWNNTTRLGELRLWLDDDGNVARAVDRAVDLDEDLR